MVGRVTSVRTNIKQTWMTIKTTEDKLDELGAEIEAIAKRRKLSLYRMRKYIGDGAGNKTELCGGAMLHNILRHTEGAYTMVKFLDLLRGMGKTIVIVDDKGVGASVAEPTVPSSAVSPDRAGREDVAATGCASEPNSTAK